MSRPISLALLGLVAASFTPSPAEAQRWARRIHRMIDDHYSVEIGLIGGPNRNTMTGAGPVDAKFRGAVGGFVSVPLTPGLRLRPEALITGKLVGTRQVVFPPCLPDVLCDPIASNETASFTWAEVPVLLEANFGRITRARLAPKIYGGPFVGIRLACSFSTPVQVTPQSPEDHLIRSCGQNAVGPVYNNGDAGFVLGGGLSFGAVGLGLRWTRSLVPIANSGSGAGIFEGAKHSTLAVMFELGASIR